MNNEKELFPIRENFNPQIYAYEVSNPEYKGLLKIGYTTTNVEERVKAQFPVLQPTDNPYTIVFSKSSMREDGTSFTDRDLHKYLKKRGFENPNGEWFRCSCDDVCAAFLAIEKRIDNLENRIYSFKLRQEQEDAIKEILNEIW